MTAVESLVADMVAEGESLDALVADLGDDTWRTLTPAVGWTIAHQIGHLSWTDRVATLSAADPDAFVDVLARVPPTPQASSTPPRSWPPRTRLPTSSPRGARTVPSWRPRSSPSRPGPS